MTFTVNFDQLWKVFVGKGHNAKLNKNKSSGLYNLHESVLLTLSKTPKYNTKKFESIESIVYFVNNRKNKPATDNQCKILKSCVTTCATRCRAPAISSQHNKQAFAKQEDYILYHVMYLVQKNGLIKSPNSEPFAKNDIKALWDVLQFPQNRSIAFQTMWNRFKNTSIVRPMNGHRNKYILNKPQLEKQAIKNFKQLPLLNKLSIIPEERLTTKSVNLIQHLLVKNIRKQLQNMKLQIDENEIIKAIETKGHDVNTIINHFMNKKFEKLSLNGSSPIENNTNNNKKRSKKRNKIKKRKRKKIRDAKSLFDSESEEIDIIHPPRKKRKKCRNETSTIDLCSASTSPIKNEQTENKEQSVSNENTEYDTENNENNVNNVNNENNANNVNNVNNNENNVNNNDWNSKHEKTDSDDDVIREITGKEYLLKMKQFQNEYDTENTVICPSCCFENSIFLPYCECCDTTWSFE